MVKTILWMALLCLPLPSYAFETACDTVTPSLPPVNGAVRDDSLDLDSVWLELDDVVVTATRMIVKNDRKLFYPRRGQIEASTSGLDLLNRLHLPGLSVNPVFGSVSLSGGRTVQLRRNGVIVSEKELSAISPSDIVRIDYIDTPGPRYEGADLVIDIITARHNSGGHVAGEFINAIGNRKFASMDNIAFSHSDGPSEWSVNGAYFFMNRDNWMRDYEETRFHAGGVAESRREVGLPVKIGNSGLIGDVNYAFIPSESDMLNVRFNMGWELVPYSEEGDRHSYLYTSGSTLPVEISEHSSERSLTPLLSLFYRHSFQHAGNLTFEVTGSQSGSRCRRRYSESGAQASDEVIVSDNRGHRKSLVADVLWEKNLSGWTLMSGAHHLQRLASDRYDGSVSGEIEIRQSESSVYGGLSYRAGNWAASASVKGLRLYSRQGLINRDDYYVQPSLMLAYNRPEGLSLRYSGDYSAASPSVSMMSDVEQRIDAGMVVRGNPHLDSYRVMRHRLNAGYTHSVVDVDWSTEFRREFHPVMSEIIRDGDMFVRTYANQRSFDCLSSELTVTLHPLGDCVSLSCSPLINRYISRGNSYTHTHTMFRFRWNLDLKFGNWIFSYNTFDGPANRMYGEELIEEKTMHLMLAGYAKPSWSLQAGVFNPFMKTYWMETKNLSAVAPYTSRAYCHRNPYFTIKASFSLSYGRKHNPKSIMPVSDVQGDDATLMKGFK